MNNILKCVVFIFLFLSLIVPVSPAYMRKIEVMAVEGDVKILPKGKKSWINAGVTMALGRGDRIKTGPASSCAISFDKKMKNVVGILENSDVIILLKKDEKIEIIDADLYAILSAVPRGSVFEVRTPVATCGVRGTGLGIKGNGNGVEATAYKNDIYLKGTAGEEEVKEGYMKKVNKAGNISSGTRTSPADIKKFQAWHKKISEIVKSTRNSRSKRRRFVSGSIRKMSDKTSEISDKVREKNIEGRGEKTVSGGGGGREQEY